MWKFIKKRSASIELRDQLHAIWYFILVLCMPVNEGSFIGIVYPWTALAPSYLQNLNFSARELGRVSPVQGKLQCTNQYITPKQSPW